jgi:ribonuclease Z
LGTASALPVHGRFTTSQYVHIHHQHFLIDCGEGCQIQLANYKIKRNKINHILISHLHGDHVYGLPGLLGSFNHFNRTHPLHIYGPPGLKKYLGVSIDITGNQLGFELIIHELDANGSGKIIIDDEIWVEYFPLKHRIPNLGYRLFYHDMKLKMRKEAILAFGLTIDQIIKAKAGEDLKLQDGSIVKNEALTYPPSKPISYAFCSDTLYDLELTNYLMDANVLYHETTYLDGMEKEAAQRMHATLGQAIDIAVKSNVGKLITGHYSSRYRDLKDFQLAAARSHFPVQIGKEGDIYEIG